MQKAEVRQTLNTKIINDFYKTDCNHKFAKISETLIRQTLNTKIINDFYKTDCNHKFAKISETLTSYPKRGFDTVFLHILQ
ncbi:hypothetical protein QE152_g32378 [Popillia japonica]|uniref:Uncharacterized protein n=1 Tax=Popillia japonica TaxID=7064 RepID=A0AAW1IZM8_POPJA